MLYFMQYYAFAVFVLNLFFIFSFDTELFTITFKMHTDI